jgi:hypothetical protein
MNDFAQAAGMESPALSEWIGSQVDGTIPTGARGPAELRLMIAHGGKEPSRKTLEAFAESSPHQPTLIELDQGDFVVCQEMQKLPFGQLVLSLLEGRSEALEFVERLYTRSDVHWTGVHEQFQNC